MRNKILIFTTGFVSGVLATKFIFNNLTLKLDNKLKEEKEDYIKIQPEEKREEIIINLD